jgi:hypothetical protein
MISIGKLPVIIAFLSIFLPQLLGHFLEPPGLFHVPLFLTLFFFALFLIYVRKMRFYLVSRWFFTIIIFQLLLLAYQVLTEKGFVLLGAGVSLFFLVFIFGNFLVYGKPTPGSIIKGVSLLYAFLLFALVIEFFIVISGGQGFLAKALPNYKTYNPSEILKQFGIGGLNSLAGGSQIAGVVSLFSFLWFATLYNDYARFRMIGKTNLLILVISSFFIYIISMTGTTNVLLIIAVFMYVFFYLKSRKSKKNFIFFVTIIMFIAIFLVYNGVLFSRFTTFNTITLPKTAQQFIINQNITLFDSYNLDITSHYFFYLMSPVFAWLNLDWFTKLVGVGINYNDYTVHLSGDNGFGIAILYKSGLLGALFVISGLLAACYKPLLSVRRSTRGRVSLWSHLGVMFSINSFLFLFSTMHYFQAFDNAATYPIFALVIALSIYCYKMDGKLFRRKSHLKILEIEPSVNEPVHPGS